MLLSHVKYNTFYRILVLFSACVLLYIRWENKRILSDNENNPHQCNEPVEQCPEGEEAYFRTYPDVGKNWTSAYSHWIEFGKEEGRHYICHCPKSQDDVDSEPEKQNDSGFVVVAIFKDEATNFKEWISHYLWQGASHFYLIDNGSTDDWESTIPEEVHSRITVTRDELKHAQTHLYNSLIPMLKEKHPDDWAVVVDLDEFLYARLPDTVSSFLSKVPDDICQVHIPWKMFGSSGHVSQPKGGVRCSFTRCGVEARVRFGGEGACGFHINPKSAVKVSKLSSFEVHWHAMNPGCGAYHETNGLQLNHYPIQSKEWFEKVKIGKGDVASGGLDQIRTWEYFESYDKTSSDCEDTELCSMLNCCVSLANVTK